MYNITDIITNEWEGELMYIALYVEINVLCILILMYIAYNLNKNVDKSIEKVSFLKVVWAIIVILALDMFWGLMDKWTSNTAIFFNNITNILYRIDTGVIGYLWFIYSENKIHRNLKRSLLQKFCISIPLIILITLCVTSPWTKLIFYIDKSNIYHRGSIYFVQILCASGYLIAATAHAIIEAIKANEGYRRMECLSLCSFSILPAVGVACTYTSFGLPIMWPMATMSILMIYCNFQEYQISKDELTGLNNRRYLDVYVESIVKDSHVKMSYFIMIDIDKFKNINDLYGHLEGDNALIETADMLRTACDKKNVFLARYGGDEFAIVYRTIDEKDVNMLILEIRDAFLVRNNITNLQYNIDISIGLGKCTDTVNMSAKELVKSADQALYEEKKRKKQIK